MSYELHRIDLLLVADEYRWPMAISDRSCSPLFHRPMARCSRTVPKLRPPMVAQQQRYCCRCTGARAIGKAYSAPPICLNQALATSFASEDSFQTGFYSVLRHLSTHVHEARLAEMSSSTLYNYIRLDYKTIRVVRVAAGQWQDPIRCKLLRRGLDEASEKYPYRALSYVWGSSKVTETIYLEGHLFQITLNLSCALRHLRKVDQDIHLWVDALVSSPSGLDPTSQLAPYIASSLLILA